MPSREDTAFQSGAVTPVVDVMDRPDFFVAFRELIAKRRGRVFAPVVDEDDLPSLRDFREDLSSQFHRAFDVGLLVERGEDNRERWGQRWFQAIAPIAPIAPIA